MALTYTTCCGSRSERTACGGKDGCRASVQSYEGSICISNRIDENGTLIVRVGTNDGSSCCTDWNSNDFTGTFQEFKNLLKFAADTKKQVADLGETFKEFKDLLNLAVDIKSGKVSVVRHREPKNKIKK